MRQGVAGAASYFAAGWAHGEGQGGALGAGGRAGSGGDVEFMELMTLAARRGWKAMLDGRGTGLNGVVGAALAASVRDEVSRVVVARQKRVLAPTRPYAVFRNSVRNSVVLKALQSACRA